MKGSASEVVSQIRGSGPPSTLLQRTKKWMGHARDRSESPWFYEDAPYHDFPVPILLIGALRRSGAMLRIAFLVLQKWWKSPFEPEELTNGSRLVATATGGTFKPLIWLASVVIAGIAGTDFSANNSGIDFATRLTEFVYFSFALVLVTGMYQWYKILKRLGRELNRWVDNSNQLSVFDCREMDITLFGYAIGNRFRSRMRVNGVGPFSMFSFFAILFFAFAVGSLH